MVLEFRDPTVMGQYIQMNYSQGPGNIVVADATNSLNGVLAISRWNGTTLSESARIDNAESRHRDHKSRRGAGRGRRRRNFVESEPRPSVYPAGQRHHLIFNWLPQTESISSLRMTPEHEFNL